MPDLKLLFRDLTQLGLPKSQFSLMNDETSYNYNPDRYNFYVNLLDNVSDPEQTVASKVFGILARNRRQHEKIQEKIDHIAAAISYLKTVYTREDQTGGQTLKEDLNTQLLRMPIINKEYSIEDKKDMEEMEEEEEIPFLSPSAPSAPSAPPSDGPSETLGNVIEQIGGSYFSERLNELNKAHDQNLTKKQKIEAEDYVAVEYKNNPLYSPELEQATYTDRIVFISVTFVFRAITLLLVQSAINTQFIDTFVKAFTYYFLIYSILFTIWILIVNMRKDNHIMGLLFYYVNANYDASVWFKRIGVHLMLQLLILPIPILLTPKFKNKSETDSFEKRERLYNTLTFFTFIIWIITSLIALRA